MKAAKKPSERRFAALRKLIPAIGVAVLAASAVNAHAQKVDKVTFGWPAANAITLAHVQFGRDLGYFKDERVEVEVVPLKGSFPIIQQLMTGNLTAGYVGLDSVVVSHQPGKQPLPIRFYYNYLRSSLWEIVVLKDSPIKTIEDLKGKPLGVAGMQYGNIPVTRALFGNAGFKPEEMVFQTVGTDAPAYRALTTKQIAALNLWDTLHATLEAEGTELRRLPMPEEVYQSSSHGLAVNADTLKNNPDMLTRFGRAWAKSIVACKANSEACVKSFWKAYPAQKPSMGTEAEKLARENKILTARLEKLTYFRPGEKKQWGAFADRDIQNIIKLGQQGGIITKTDIPLDQIYSNALIPAINKFDEEAVIKAAKAAKY